MTTNEHETINAAELPDNSAPRGVGGLLLFYALFPAFLGGVVLPIWLVTQTSDFGLHYVVVREVILLALNVIGLNLIYFVRRPITRYFHICLNAAIGTELIVIGVISSDLRAMVTGVIVLLIWSGYWFRSRRVRATYYAKA